MRITFAVPWTDPDTGTTHKPDSSATVDDRTARRLIGDGWARPADPPAKKAAAKTTARKSAARATSRRNATRRTTSTSPARPSTSPSTAGSTPKE